MTFSGNIKKFRLRAGMTQEQLGSAVGVSSQAVSKWENSDTYPDATLLVPLANTLGVSLDSLFANREIYDADTAQRLYKSLERTERGSMMEKAMDFCWHMEKALFRHCDNTYSPGERHLCGTSYCDTDSGFSYVSSSSDFFAIFPEADGGRNLDEMKIRQIFTWLGDGDVISAVLFLMKVEQGYTFEKEVLAKSCFIPLDKIDNVMAKLEEIKLVNRSNVNINGMDHTLYRYVQRCEILMLLIAAGEVGYNSGYTYQKSMRNNPYLK